MPDHHVFLSYSRADNEPKKNGLGFIDIFYKQLLLRHRLISRRKLDLFYDKERIENGDHWRTNIQVALRRSRLFIAVLSQNYLDSEICMWEFEEYVRREHSLVRGGAGIRPIYFAVVPMLEKDGPTPPIERQRIITELSERNRDYRIDLREWAQDGLQALLEMDARERLKALAAQPVGPLEPFHKAVCTIDNAISRRLDDSALADMAQNFGSIQGSYAHFVGRSHEIAEIHRNLIDNNTQLITALHGLGGQGKSALARQYAHAFSGHYAAGGRWEVGCESHSSLALVFDQLTQMIADHDPDNPRFAAVRLSKEQTALPDLVRLECHKNNLKRFVEDGWEERLAASIARLDQRHCHENRDVPEPRMLVIMDNVTKHNLWDAEVQAVMQSPPWLEVIITTREAPQKIGDMARMKSLTVQELPHDDAIALLRDFRPFSSEDDLKAAHAIATDLGGYTLAVELVGAFLQSTPRVSYMDYYQRLKNEGLSSTDDLAGLDKVQIQIRHREKQVGMVVNSSLADLSEVERTALHFAAHFPADIVVGVWLQIVTSSRHPDVTRERAIGYESLWDTVLQNLSDRKLLTHADNDGVYRLHRVIGAHLRALAGPERDKQNRETLIEFTEQLSTFCEDSKQGWDADRRLLGWVSPLLALVETLVATGPFDLQLGRQMGVCATALFTHRSSADAGVVFMRIIWLTQAFVNDHRDDLEAARDLSVSQERLGAFYAQRGQSGDMELAYQMYQASLATRERLLKDNPDSGRAARDLSVSQIKLGDFYAQRDLSGDMELAYKMYQASLATAVRLFEANLESGQAARDLSVAQGKLGDFYAKRCLSGDTELAHKMYQASLATRERLFEANSDSWIAARDLSVSQIKLGDFYVERGLSGDTELAYQMYNESLATDERLFEANQRSPQAALDLSVSLERMSDYLLKDGDSQDLQQALDYSERAFSLRIAIANSNPANATLARESIVTAHNLLLLFAKLGRENDALQLLAIINSLLADYITKGFEIDQQMAPIIALYDELK